MLRFCGGNQKICSPVSFSEHLSLPLDASSALPTETKVESGTSQSKTGTSVNASNSGNFGDVSTCGEPRTSGDDGYLPLPLGASSCGELRTSGDDAATCGDPRTSGVDSVSEESLPSAIRSGGAGRVAPDADGALPDGAAAAPCVEYSLFGVCVHSGCSGSAFGFAVQGLGFEVSENSLPV